MQMRQRNHTCIILVSLLVGLCVLWLFSCKTEAATVPVSATIPVTCTGGNPLETLTVVMEMESKEMQTPDQLFIRMKAGEEGAFTIHYVYPGTYHYEIHQETGSDSKTTYDSTLYKVDVYVTEDENGKLYADPVIYPDGSNEKQARISFFNSASSTPSKSSRTSSVQTGDTNDLFFYVELLIASAASLAMIGRALFKKKRG